MPIREIQAGGYRVLADNPETPGQAVADYGEFDRETWRVLQLQLKKPEGGWLKVALVRPLSWIEETPRNSDGAIWLEFEELGIANWAEVLSIEDCPQNIIGDGRLVTGTFHHSAANVIELSFSHSAETVTTTANHPFWSEDRQEFVQAAELGTGEQIRLRNGTTSQLVAAVRLDEEIPVYNLEVDGEHVYYVGLDGVLVHNGNERYRKLWKGPDGKNVVGERIILRDPALEVREGFDEKLYPGRGVYFGVDELGRKEALSWADYYRNGLQGNQSGPSILTGDPNLVKMLFSTLSLPFFYSSSF